MAWKKLYEHRNELPATSRATSFAAGLHDEAVDLGDGLVPLSEKPMLR